MATFNARHFVMMSEDEVLAIPSGEHVLLLEDGTKVPIFSRRLILTWQLWHLHRKYPNVGKITIAQMPGTALTKKNQPEKPEVWEGVYQGKEISVTSAVRTVKEVSTGRWWQINRPIRKDFDQIVGSEVEQAICDGLKVEDHDTSDYNYHKDPNSKWAVAYEHYETQQSISDFVLNRLGAYAISTDLSDVMEITNLPVIKEEREFLRNMVNPQPADVEAGYARLAEIIQNPIPELWWTGIARMARRGFLSSKQMNQLLIAIGVRFDPYGRLYLRLVTRGYIDGFIDLTDTMQEAPSATRSLLMSEDPLKLSENMNRLMQMHGQFNRRVVGDDCGTPYTARLMINSPADLLSLKWKYIVKKGKVVLFNHNDLSQINKEVDLRVTYMCQNADRGTVCKKCFGKIHTIIPPRTNIANFLIADPMGRASQLMLSIKHVEVANGAIQFKVESTKIRWFKLDTENKTKVLMANANGMGSYVIRVAREDFVGMAALKEVSSTKLIDPTRIFKSLEMGIVKADLDGNFIGDMELMAIGIGIGNTGYSSLSREVLEEVRLGNYREEDSYVDIHLRNFNGKPVFITPRITEDVVQYNRAIESFMMGADKSKKKSESPVLKTPSVASYKDATQALLELKALFGDKTPSNIVQIEMFIRSCMCLDPANGDYRIPRGGESYTILPARKILLNRSVATAMSYQKSEQFVFSQFETYMTREGMTHPIDPLFMTGYRPEGAEEYTPLDT